MLPEHFHLNQPYWCWALLAIPLYVGIALFYAHRQQRHSNFSSFIDPHLLPHLCVTQPKKNKKHGMALGLWSLVWACFILGMAGPRWDYTEIESFAADESLVILLDLSQSMNAQDVKPSRVIRARQEIEDILVRQKKVGLIAFAAMPHMISPITDDTSTITHLLPSLGTDLIRQQGSQLGPALDMAVRLLSREEGKNKSILLISDGGFEDMSVVGDLASLTSQDITLHTMGVGTSQGAPVVDSQGQFIKQQGQLVVSKLQDQPLRQLSQHGGGVYITSHYSDQDSDALSTHLDAQAKQHQLTARKIRFWQERFYILLLPLLVIILYWFRRGAVLLVLVLCVLPPHYASAAGWLDWFKNDAQKGKQALEQQHYEEAERYFSDAYRRGVVHYKAGNYEQAEQAFSRPGRSEQAVNNQYNLANSLAKQQKLAEAVTAYEALLAQHPGHANAQHNLDLIKKILEQQQKQPQDQNQSQDDQSQQDSSQDSDDEQQQNQESKSQQQENAEQQDGSEQEKESQSQAQSEDNQQKQQAQDTQPEAEEPEEETQEEQTQTQAEQSDQDPNDADPTNAKAAGEPSKTQADLDADQWLNRLNDDPKPLLQNQFYIESQRQKPKQSAQPW